jgi:hypothetical protein
LSSDFAVHLVVQVAHLEVQVADLEAQVVHFEVPKELQAQLLVLDVLQSLCNRKPNKSHK